MTVTIGSERLTLDQLRSLAAEETGVVIAPEALTLLDKGAATVAEIVDSGRTVYGVNTGFGLLANTRIADADLETLQKNLVLSHACGVGDALPRPTVRLIMALKIASLTRGASGVRRETVQLLADMLNKGLTPLIPAKGSVGASGDLAPLAHLAAAMIGEPRQRVWSGDDWAPADMALEAAGLKPLTLAAKEGLALLNGTQCSTALALVGLFRAETLFRSALVTGALSTDALKGSDAPFDARIHQLRGQPGQIDTASALRTLMAGSAIRDSHRDDCLKVQDPYSFRCQPQVMGAVLDVMRSAARTLVIEANAATDNPLVFPDSGDVLSGGNFHAEPVAFAADQLALCIAEIGSLSERRVAVLIDPKMSGLPAFLTRDPGLNSGFMIAQVTAAALASENKMLAHPAVVDTIPTSAGQEDHVSMATHGARRLGDMADNVANIVAVELLAAAEGVEIHRPMKSSPALEQAMAALRAVAPAIPEDRYFADLIQTAAGVIQRGLLSAICPEDVALG